MKSRKSRIDKSEDDDLLATAGELGPYIPLEEVDAVCVSIDKHYFGVYGRWKLEFNFEVIEPVQYQGISLVMYVRTEPSWKDGAPPGSKLLECATVALGRQLNSKEPIRKALFLRKVFRCRLKQVENAVGKRTIVVSIKQRLAG